MSIVIKNISIMYTYIPTHIKNTKIVSTFVIIVIIAFSIPHKYNLTYIWRKHKTTTILKSPLTYSNQKGLEDSQILSYKRHAKFIFVS